MVEVGTSNAHVPSSTLERFLPSFFIISKVCFLIQNWKRPTSFFEKQEHYLTKGHPMHVGSEVP